MMVVIIVCGQQRPLNHTILIDKHRMPSGIVQPNQRSSSFDKQTERLVTGSKSPDGYSQKGGACGVSLQIERLLSTPIPA